MSVQEPPAAAGSLVTPAASSCSSGAALLACSSGAALLLQHYLKLLRACQQCQVRYLLVVLWG